MNYITQNQVQALFRHQTNGLWTGHVHMMNKFYEYVPFALNGERYAIKFLYPPYQNGIGAYSDMLFKTLDGGDFIPQRQHRIITLLAIGIQGELTPMLPVDISLVDLLSQALSKAIITYCQHNGNASQFFFQAEPEFGNFIRNALPIHPIVQQSSLMLSFYDELATPFYGFSVTPSTLTV